MTEGGRVVSVKVRHASSLNDAEYYNGIVPSFVFEGGVGHVLVEKNSSVSTRMQK